VLLQPKYVRSGHGLSAGRLAVAVAITANTASFLLPGTPALWAAILATTIGPGLLVTGSVATLITRRIAHDGNVRHSAGNTAPSDWHWFQPSSPRPASGSTSPDCSGDHRLREPATSV